MPNIQKVNKLTGDVDVDDELAIRLDFGWFPCCGATPSMFLLSAVTNRDCTDTL